MIYDALLLMFTMMFVIVVYLMGVFIFWVTFITFDITFDPWIAGLIVYPIIGVLLNDKLKKDE